MRIERSSAGSCSHCRYENGETKSKDQSALGIGNRGAARGNGVTMPRSAKRELREKRTALLRRQSDPAGDLVERAVAAGTQSRRWIDHADAGARRADLTRVGHGCTPTLAAVAAALPPKAGAPAP